ncbi:hypothetical protein HPB47_006478 [Ixodes persulcatus]|uniref:Uncharacterized protein n=1 Tax=Ixodes persulcatus TaxID=34615 RepID=A0AC60PAR2_IXOPE|nr:hypothetical protein HPB47_006478 [Ixodes persulcatus]
MELRSGERRRSVTPLDRDGANDNSVDERGEPSLQSRQSVTVGTHEEGVRDGRSSSSLIEREIKLVRVKERLLRLELEIERVRAENRPGSSGGSTELNLREEVLSLHRLMKGVLTQMPSSELLVPSWFDGVENVFATCEVPERLRGSLVRLYFTERMRALVNRLPVGEASDYSAVKERVLLELKLSPAEYRRLFLKATRMETESWTQFATRVESYFEYYARSRSIDYLEDLLAFMVSDRIRNSLPVDIPTYVTLSETGKWLKPAKVAALADRFDEGERCKKRDHPSGSMSRAYNTTEATSLEEKRENQR